MKPHHFLRDHKKHFNSLCMCQIWSDINLNLTPNADLIIKFKDIVKSVYTPVFQKSNNEIKKSGFFH